MKKLKDENGIALILALVMLLILSALAITISFMANVDFQTMSTYKQGQEAFLAAERCIEEARRQFEQIGVETLFFQLQGGISSGIELQIGENGVDCSTEPERCAVCRTGPRNYDSSSGPVPFPEIPPPTKNLGRPLKDTSLPSGGVGGAALFPTTVLVTGKDARDRDKDDTDSTVNTGTEVSAGFESFIPGGASNVY